MEKVPEIEDPADAEPPPLSPSSPDVSPSIETVEADPIKFSIISRQGVGTAGKRIPVLTNLFKVSVNAPDAIFFQYSVSQVSVFEISYILS